MRVFHLREGPQILVDLQRGVHRGAIYTSSRVNSCSLDLLVPDLRSLITLPMKLARELLFFLRNMKIHDRFMQREWSALT